MFPSSGRLLETDPHLVHEAYIKLFFDGIPIVFNFKFQGSTFFTLNIPAIAMKGIFSWIKWDWLFHVIVPILVIAITGLALYTRLVRSHMIDTMGSDYILSARASGFSENQIMYKFALRNVLLPVMTFLGLGIGTVIGGSPLVEWILGWPGLGLFLFKAFRSYHQFPNYEFDAFITVCIVMALMILLVNLITDIAYCIIDPRIRLE